MRFAPRSTAALKLARWLPTLERLEARETPAVTATLSQTAAWTDIGPNQITDGQVRNIGANNPVIGAVSALAAHPTNPNIMFAAGPNGGVWRTENALATSPTWVPLSDEMASLGVSDLAIDPDNPNRLLVGIGATSDQPGTTTNNTLGNQQERVRGDRIGVLYTENALAPNPTWRVLNNNIAGKLVTNVVIRSGYMIVGTDAGTYRSSNNGATFANVYESTLNNGVSYAFRQFDQGVYDLVENPRLRNQFYLATKPGAGLTTNEVWRSDDGGVRWGRVTGPEMQLSARTVNVQLSVRDAGASDNQVYVAVSNSKPVGAEQFTPGVGFVYAWEQRSGTLSSVSWSANQGGVWTRMDAPRTETSPQQAASITYDTSTGVITVSTFAEHRLQNGDEVRLSGNIRRILSFDEFGVPQFDAPFPIVLDGFYFIDVTGPNSFTLRNRTITGGTGLFTDGSWRRVVGATPGENPEFLQVLASQTAPNLLFLGGDSTQWNFGGATSQPTTFTGSVWVGNRFANPELGDANDSNQWSTLTDGNTGSGTSPGADTRELIFDANGNLWIATGTGVYRRSNLTSTGDWVSSNGNLGLGQFWGAAYDTISNVVVGVTQDTGAVVSSAAGSQTYTSINSNNLRNRMRDQEFAYETVVDDVSFAGSGLSVRYIAANDFGSIRRQVVDANNVVTSDTFLNFANAFTTNFPLSGITDGSDLFSYRDASQRIVMGLNGNNRTRAVYGLNNVYEDADPNGVTGFIVSNVTPVDGQGVMTGQVRSLSYGGKRDGINFNQILYVGTSSGELWVRGEFGVTFNRIAPGTGEVTDIEQDPDDWRHVFVAQGGRVYESRRAGEPGSWTEVSAGLVTTPVPGTDLPSGNGLTTEIRSIALFDPNPGTANVGNTGDVVLMAAGRGGVYRRTLSACGTDTIWSEYGSGLPNTVVTDLNFDSTGNRLVAATFGRGVWSVADVRPTLISDVTLTISSDGAADNIIIAPDAFDPNAINVVANGTTIGRFNFGQFNRLVVNGNGGGDTVQIGNQSSTLFVNYPIFVDLGGDAGDSLVIDASGSTTDLQATVTPTTIGAGVGDNMFSSCGSLTYTGLAANGTIRLLTGSGNDRVLFDTTMTSRVTLNGGGGSNLAVFNGTAGNDVMYVGGSTVVANALRVDTAAVQRFRVAGSGGVDWLHVGGTEGDDTFTISQSGLQSGAVGGVSVPVDYFDMDNLNLVPYGGNNSLIWHDVSNTIWGSPIDPGAGIDFIPTGATSGYIRLNRGAGTTAYFNGVNGSFVMNGDPFSTNTGDVLTVFGVSTAGLEIYGEATSTNGSDTITASADGVTITNAVLGTLRPVIFGRTTSGMTGFSNVWVRGGNEAGVGDTFIVSPTLATNLLMEGGNPNSLPGDSLFVTTNGPATSGVSTDPALGPPHTRVTNRGDRASVGYVNIEQVTASTTDPSNPTSPPVPSFGFQTADLFAVGSTDIPSQVRVYNLDGSLRFTLNPYPGYNGSVRVAVGDVTGDGKSDIITAPGVGGAPHVRVFDGQTGLEYYSFYAYDPSFGGGVTLAVGNFNSDQYADIVTGAGAGGGPHVRIFDGASAKVLREFMAYSPSFTGGVSVAAGDVTGDGLADIVTGAGAGGGPHVRVFDGTSLAVVREFMAYNPAFTGGVSVAAGDINGDGLADIITGAGPGGGPHVRVFDAVTTGELRSFFVNDPNVSGAPPISITGGVNVAVGDLDGDGLTDILTGRGRGFRPFAQFYKVSARSGAGVIATQSTLLAVNTFGDSYSSGISVGG